MMEYKHWEAKVNGLMLVQHGVGVDDIPDMPWYDWYKNEMIPQDAVDEAIKIVNAGEWV